MSVLNNYAVKLCPTCETSIIETAPHNNLCSSCEMEAFIIKYSALQNVDQILDIIVLELSEGDFPFPHIVYDLYETFKQSTVDENTARLIGQTFEPYM